jgi:uncharacterized membrane protein
VVTNLVLAAAFLLVSHFGISSTPLRPWLAERLGERPYQTVYTLVAFGAFAWLIFAYWRAPYIEVWLLRAWAAWLPLIVMPFALLLVVCGVSTPNPTAVGSPDTLDQAQPVRGIARVTRHPFMWGAALWALSHMVPNGDAASLVLFGSLAVLALLGTLLIDHKFALRRGAQWRQFAAASSNLPFGAILAGRQQLVPAEIGWRRAGVALALYLLLLVIHPWLFGVSPFGAI